jgi:pyridoxamine 5'-phosphate oxidase
MLSKGFLPTTLPGDPMPLFEDWFNGARKAKAQPNPDAMALATTTVDGRPAVRVVLCKRLVVDPGYVVFFTNYDSRKGSELAANPRAAVVFHWDAFGRQVRLEGPIVHSPAAESDEYFASRALDSRIGAWASLQSQPLDKRSTLLKRVATEAARFGTHVPRPPNWGGYRLWPEAVELWIEGPFRVHDRARWTRSLEAQGDGFAPGPWAATRLFP